MLWNFSLNIFKDLFEIFLLCPKFQFNENLLISFPENFLSYTIFTKFLKSAAYSNLASTGAVSWPCYRSGIVSPYRWCEQASNTLYLVWWTCCVSSLLANTSPPGLPRREDGMPRLHYCILAYVFGLFLAEIKKWPEIVKIKFFSESVYCYAC